MAKKKEAEEAKEARSQNDGAAVPVVVLSADNATHVAALRVIVRSAASSGAHLAGRVADGLRELELALERFEAWLAEEAE
jgi:hypothetical protein